MLPPFELLEPHSLDQALKMLATSESVPLAGGTNLLPDLRARGEAGGRFISLAALDQLHGIEHSDSRVLMGARTTLSDILHDPLMPTAAPSLVSMAKVFAGSMVRNAATVAGNICYGSPSADVVPPLLSLDAELTLASAAGERTLSLNDFLLDYKKTARRPDELLISVAWAPPTTATANLFYKLGRRRGDAITVVGVAVTITIEKVANLRSVKSDPAHYPYIEIHLSLISRLPTAIEGDLFVRRLLRRAFVINDMDLPCLCIEPHIV